MLSDSSYIVCAELESGVAILAARNAREAKSFLSRLGTHERMTRSSEQQHAFAHEVVARACQRLPSLDRENLGFPVYPVTWTEARALVDECSAHVGNRSQPHAED